MIKNYLTNKKNIVVILLYFNYFIIYQKNI